MKTVTQYTKNDFQPESYPKQLETWGIAGEKHEKRAKNSYFDYPPPLFYADLYLDYRQNITPAYWALR